MEDLARQLAVVADEADDIIDFHVKEPVDVQEQQPSIVSVPVSSTALPSSDKNTMVGFDDLLLQVVDELTRDESNLQILPIVGMGGIGKTTLAQNAFNHPYIVNRFDKRIWFTISQQYSVREILLKYFFKDEKDFGTDHLGVAELGVRLHKLLCGERYLIIIDDIWSIKAWEDFMLYLPNNENGSRILVTTRLLDVACSLRFDNHYFKVNFLDEDKSWDLLCEKLLHKKVALIQSWRKLEGKLLDVVADFLWQLFLPIYLKPCFLYMRVFPEDGWISVSELIKLWICEGFLKPIRGKSLEEVAKEYLKDLIDRNLILIRDWTRSGRIKACGIHDILRELCVRESEREHLICVPKAQKIHISIMMEDYACFLCGHWLNRHNKIHLQEVGVGSQSKTVGLPDPVEGQDSTILEDLSTLGIGEFCCSEEIVKRIPNLKELRVRQRLSGDYSLVKLNKLESLRLIGNNSLLEDIGFPTSLKKLILSGSEIPWKKITIIGSSLPNLEVLKLDSAFVGPEWNPIEGEFLRLKVLTIDGIDLEQWGAEDIHFPNLHGLGGEPGYGKGSFIVHALAVASAGSMGSQSKFPRFMVPSYSGKLGSFQLRGSSYAKISSLKGVPSCFTMGTPKKRLCKYKRSYSSFSMCSI
ncbi:UNVERIFIED_CONTAM: Disease resistance protein RPM1 [Sesamum calycinum]|uniref:Disease resistance protein RPM1 n=1 Tax=Sesamum calycinum TaxID=2727403 RepID=A0AAW2NF52_9LAMI